jgi:hypothetical protein
VGESVLGGAAAHYAPIGEEEGPPSVLKKEHRGGGRVVYFAMPIGNQYLEFGVEDMRRMMAGAVRWAAVDEPPIRVEGAPKTVAVTAYRQAGESRLVIHLVDSVRNEANHPLAELPRYYDMRIELDVTTEPKRVFIPANEGNLLWKVEHNKLMLTIQAFQSSMVIVVE